MYKSLALVLISLFIFSSLVNASPHHHDDEDDDHDLLGDDDDYDAGLIASLVIVGVAICLILGFLYQNYYLRRRIVYVDGQDVVLDQKPHNMFQ